MSDVLIVSTQKTQYFADLLAKQIDVKPLQVERKIFGDGERYYKFEIADRADLVGKDIIVVGTTDNDQDFLELIRLGNALADLGSRKRVFVIPFFGYSTMEKAVLPGEVATTKIQARLLSSIPNSGGGNYFLFLDLHSGGIIHYFEGDAVRFELSAENLLIDAIKQLKLNNFVLASADLGRPLLIQRLASFFNAELAFIAKARDFDKTKVLAVIGDVNGKDVVIYDDMARSGSTLIQAAQTYLKKGASSVCAVLSHLAINNEGVIRALDRSDLVKVIGTNSHPMSQSNQLVRSKKFVVSDVSPLFAQAIKNILK